MSSYRPPAGSQRRPREESPRDTAARRIGAIAWPSFFAAGVATMVFFAIVDPVELARITWPRLELSRDGRTIATTDLHRVGYLQVREPAVL